MILTFSIQRGGAGKTSTAAAIAWAAARDGKRTLCIDLDPQGCLTYTMKADPSKGGSFDLLANSTPAAAVIQKTESGVYVIPASWSLSTVRTGTGSAKRLQEALKPIKEKYDLIVLDTAPTAGETQYNALQCADGAIIPTQCDIFGLQGVYQITDTVRAFQRSNPNLTIKGLVITRYNSRSTLAKQLRATIEQKCSEAGIPFLGAIREGIAVQEAQALQQSLFDYAGASKPAQDYLSVYKKIMEA